MQKTLPLQIGVGAEIHQQAEFQFRRVNIVDHLRAMCVRQCGYGLDFENDFLEAQKVRLESMYEHSPSVGKREGRFRKKGDAEVFELDFQTLVVNRLGVTVTLLVVDRETLADDRVALLR